MASLINAPSSRGTEKKLSVLDIQSRREGMQDHIYIRYGVYLGSWFEYKIPLTFATRQRGPCAAWSSEQLFHWPDEAD